MYKVCYCVTSDKERITRIQVFRETAVCNGQCSYM